MKEVGNFSMRFDRVRYEKSIAGSELARSMVYPGLFGMKPGDYDVMTGDKKVLDQSYGVDIIVRSGTERNIAIAERFREESAFWRWGDITLRHMSKYTAGKLLETKHSIARFLFYAWVDQLECPTQFAAWYLIDLQRTLDIFHSGKLPFVEVPNKDDSSTFVAFHVRDLQRAGVVRKCMDPREAEVLL